MEIDAGSSHDPTNEDALLGPIDAAKLLDVHRETLLNWEKKGKLSRVDEKFRRSDLLGLKILQRKAVIAKGVLEDTLDKGEEFGVFSEDNRWSLNDVDSLLSGKKSEAKRPGAAALDPGHPPLFAISQPCAKAATADHGGYPDLPIELATRRDRVALLHWYRTKGRSPCDLPDWFYDVPEEPSFEPPSGVCFTEIVGEGLDEHGNPETVLQQTSFWIGAELVPVQKSFFQGTPEDAKESFCGLNETYLQSKIEWHNEYERRMRKLR